MRRAAYIIKAKSHKGAEDEDESEMKKNDLQLGSLHGILISTDGSVLRPDSESGGILADESR
jgi:hypothetical protein